MSDTAVAVATLTANALSERIDGTTPGGDMTSVATGNTAVIAVKGDVRGLMIIISGDGSHTATVGIEAGDEPPSERAGLGAISGLSVAATGTYILPVSAGRFIKNDDGAIELPVSGTGPVLIGAFRQPASNMDQ